ncbi:PEP-CTERM sorting domain-containing protein [Piscinibacter sp. HJYY11]|uniref:PEP-CTERM sorting domain-containing protein n=1 Tax=Piscinibacter sp. HJYY11 TaxID=2801333 RepID=UPI00191EA6B4|nr:PEP-CTERM sorting domain-containing protein [Piscinibacter sp. HJYY11]MBL0728003.1 PEP-CTERM sorting domain-containing protein [Piscinibacter sp. HJYY11]
MALRSRSFVRTLARALLPVLLGVHAALAQAVLITFDDLPPPDPEGGLAGTPVTNEYAPLGLLVNEGYLAGSGVPGTDQSLYGAPYLSLSFIGGTLPTYVSLYVSAPNRDRVFVDAAGPGGWARTVVTDGAGWPTSTPYRPNQYVSFHSETGISNLDLSAFYFLRTGPVIDDLYFGNVAPVPEPASLALGAAGVLTLWAVRRRRARPDPGA